MIFRTHQPAGDRPAWRRWLVPTAVAAGLAAGLLTPGSPASAEATPEADFVVVSCTQRFPKSSEHICQLDGGVSTGDIVTWTWLVGGAERSNSFPNFFVRVLPPSVEVTLTVTDAGGQSDSTTKLVSPAATS